MGHEDNSHSIEPTLPTALVSEDTTYYWWCPRCHQKAKTAVKPRINEIITCYHCQLEHLTI